MREPARMRARTRKRARRCGCILAATLALGLAPRDVTAQEEFGGPAFVAPGMTQTELQTVLGPPDYIQVREMRQAWQYCPSRRLFDRVFDHGERQFITVWFENFRVKHMRVYPGAHMGLCQDFIAAFTWQDNPGPIRGRAYGAYGADDYGADGGYGLK